MNVLLIQPPHYMRGNEDVTFTLNTRPPEGIPLGLAYIATALRQTGAHVDVLDIWAHQYTDEEVLARIPAYDLCGIGALSTQFKYVKWLIAELKKRSDAPVIVGNALATYSAEIVLRHTQADACCLGEGEITFVDLLTKPIAEVAGLWYRKDDAIVRNPARDYIRDLDTLGMPAWDLFPVAIYLKHTSVWHSNVPAMNVITARGCPYRCRFCSRSFRGIRLRQVDAIVSEIQHLKDKFGIRGICFEDELLVASKQRGYEICEHLEPLGITWSCQGRANIVDLELLQRMRKAGCVTVGYGVESGSQTILDNMDKAVTVAMNEAAIRNTLRAGITPFIQMMYGFPGEDLQTLRETTEFFGRLPYLGPILLAVTTPYPGSPLYDDAVRAGRIEDELQYIEKLEAGSGRLRPLVNYTAFTDDEFVDRKLETERKIYRRQRRRHPWKAAQDDMKLIPYPRMSVTTGHKDCSAPSSGRFGTARDRVRRPCQSTT